MRAIASTNDELIGSFASLTYAFQLVPRPGVLLPDELPLRVEALGGTGTDNYASARISFVLNYQSATSFRSILLDTGATSTPLGAITWGGTGRINLDQVIDVAPGTDISVFLHARAAAGTPIGDADHLKDQFGTGSAYVDPVFTLPDEWAGLVDIIGVPGQVTMPPPVPEPATWGLMAAGLALIGGVRRRRLRH